MSDALALQTSGQTSWQRNLDALRRHAGQLLLDALADPLTIEVALNPDGSLWGERLGEDMSRIGSLEAYRAEALLRTLAGMLNKVITAESPQLDGEWPLDGSRFSGALPPVAARPMFSIRKRASRVFSLDEYVRSGVMTERQKERLCEAVRDHRNILVIGGTSSGKTTLTNAIIAEVARQYPQERLIIIEDTGEIQCASTNVVFLHTTVNVSMTLLLKQSLRLRPDRILVGEVRDHAALDLLDAWNTGHEGGIATLHANSAREGLTRLRGLVTRNQYAPGDIEEVIGQAVHCLVFLQRTEQGRRVREILEVKGWSRQAHDYETVAVG